MPRTWQYSRWRRLALQGAMCLVLGASVAAAAYVGHLRSPARAPLGLVGEHGLLTYALPEGWGVELDPGPSPTLTAQEPRVRGRMLVVAIEPKARRMDAEDLIAMTLMHHLSGEPITFLGQEGVLVEASFRGLPGPGGDPGDDGPVAATIAMAAAEHSGLYAAVVLRDGTGVVVSLRGEGAFGPSSRRLLKAIVGTMQLTPGARGATATTRPATIP